MWSMWSMRPSVDMEKVQALFPGASKEEVRVAIGEPDDMTETGLTWVYTRAGWAIVYVYFDEEERFEKYRFDP